MHFALISDSREWSEASPAPRRDQRVIQQAEVEREAGRRKAALGLDEWQLREFVTGAAMPDHIPELCRQIDLAAVALSRMSPIPGDFADDLYWPRVW